MFSLVTGSLSLNVGLRAVAPSRTAPSRTVAPSMNYYAVFHNFKPGKADEFWGAMGDVDFAAMAEAQHEAGIYNHYFMPSDVEGPIMCLWECKDKEMGSDDFQAFIDGPESPAADLMNKVYPINGMGVTPSSAWPTMPATSNVWSVALMARTRERWRTGGGGGKGTSWTSIPPGGTSSAETTTSLRAPVTLTWMAHSVSEIVSGLVKVTRTVGLADQAATVGGPSNVSVRGSSVTACFVRTRR